MGIGLAGIAAVAMINGNVIGSGVCVPAPYYISGNQSLEYDYTHHIAIGLSDDDLRNGRLVTYDDMEYLTDIYVASHPGSAFEGCAGAFIEASNLTGMDPLFFFSLAGVESGWGTSDIHKNLNNPYSMGMYGDGVHNGYEVGDTFYEGIVGGALYIYQHYYLNGQTTLYLMNHFGDHSFCAEDSSWEEQIELQMSHLNELLEAK